LSEEVVAEVWKPNIMYPLPREYTELVPSMHFSTYGFGWGLRDYRGRMMATHTGGIDGMLSQILLVPEEELGIVVLTNTSPMGSFAHNAITFHVLDSYRGAAGETDWQAAFRKLAATQQNAQDEAQRKRDQSRVSGTSPSVPLEAFVGTYEDRMYGPLEVSLEQGRLVLRRHTAWVADLEHWHYDTFLARWRDPVMGETLVTFGLSPAAEVDAVAIEGLPEFHRAPDEAEGGR
jgi:hypothetical protein